MASDIASRLKQLKEKPNVENAWFVNDKVKYKNQGDMRVKELRNWGDLAALSSD